MKTTFVLILLTLSFISLSQEKEGFFQYHISVSALDTSAQTRQNAMMLRNSTLKMYYAEDLLRVEYKMGDMYTTTMVLNKKTNLSLTLMNGAMGNYAVQKPVDELDFNTFDKDTNVVIVDLNETKKILGYECKKLLVKMGGEISTYWVTDEIQVDNFGEQLINPNIPGFPLSFSKVAEGIEMTYKASNIMFELEDKEKLFSTDPPLGYTQMPSNSTSH